MTVLSPLPALGHGESFDRSRSLFLTASIEPKGIRSPWRHGGRLRGKSVRLPGIRERAAGPWIIATVKVLLRRMQAMIIRWLGSVSLSLSVLAGVAAADDGWRPASTQSRVIGSSSSTAASGALG